jgi:hypothetical protein
MSLAFRRLERHYDGAARYRHADPRELEDELLRCLEVFGTLRDRLGDDGPTALEPPRRRRSNRHAHSPFGALTSGDSED